MQLSAKHNQTTISYNNFYGGLNTTTAQEMIAENELSQCLNMEIDSTTGLLKTVDGCKLVCNTDFKIKSSAYDKINKLFISVKILCC